jgi:hypothetical protein
MLASRHLSLPGFPSTPGVVRQGRLQSHLEGSVGIETVKIVVLLVGIVAILLAFVLQLRLKNHVSMEKVRELDDPKFLYDAGFNPPKSILTDKGLYHFKIVRACYGVFAVVMLVIILLDALVENSKAG